MMRSTRSSVLGFTFSVLAAVFQLGLLLAASSAVCQIDSLQAQIELRSWVDRSEIPFNRELTFTVEASWEGDQDRFSIAPVIPPECENFEIMGSSSLNQTRVEEGRSKSVKVFRFTLKPTETGPGRISSIELIYVDNATQDSSSLSTQPLSVQITAPVKERGPKYRNILIAVVMAVFIYVIYTAARKRKGIDVREEKEDERRPEESPEIKALRQLDGISGQLEKGELGSFSTNLCRLLTDYLEAKYQIVTSGKTTGDIISSLSNLEISPERVSILKEILSACDIAKFAGEQMERDKCRNMARRAREFLEQNG